MKEIGNKIDNYQMKNVSPKYRDDLKGNNSKPVIPQIQAYLQKNLHKALYSKKFSQKIIKYGKENKIHEFKISNILKKNISAENLQS